MTDDLIEKVAKVIGGFMAASDRAHRYHEEAARAAFATGGEE